MIGVLNIMAEIGAEPVTVRNSTPSKPTACLRSLGTSSRWETSRLSTRPVVTAAPSPAVPDCSRVSDIQPASCQDRVTSLALARARQVRGSTDRRTQVRSEYLARMAEPGGQTNRVVASHSAGQCRYDGHLPSLACHRADMRP